MSSANGTVVTPADVEVFRASLCARLGAARDCLVRTSRGPTRSGSISSARPPRNWWTGPTRRSPVRRGVHPAQRPARGPRGRGRDAAPRPGAGPEPRGRAAGADGDHRAAPDGQVDQGRFWHWSASLPWCSGCTGWGRPACRTSPPCDPAAASTSSSRRPELIRPRSSPAMQRIAEDPKDSDALKTLGDLYFDAGDYTTAAQWHAKAVEVDPKDVDGPARPRCGPVQRRRRRRCEGQLGAGRGPRPGQRRGALRPWLPGPERRTGRHGDGAGPVAEGHRHRPDLRAGASRSPRTSRAWTSRAGPGPTANPRPRSE